MLSKCRSATHLPKVLILCTNADQAGAPLHVEAVVQSLHSCVDFVVVFGEEGPVADRMRMNGVSVHIVASMRSSISLVQDWVALRDVRRILRHVRPSLLHAHSSKAGLIGRIAASSFDLPCIYTVHGWGWRGLRPMAAVLTFCAEFALARFTKSYFVYVSKTVERSGRSLLRIAPANGEIIYNGVRDCGTDQERWSGELVILMPARVSIAKDHETLARAFEMLQLPSRLIFCGEGTQAEDFIQNVREWAPTRYRHIAHLGQRQDVRNLLKVANVVALISHFEALPLSIIEAMAAGRAVVASDVGGVGELIANPPCGILVQRNDVQGLLTALLALFDTSYRERLGSAGRKTFLDRFTASAMASKLHQLYIRQG